MKFYKFGIFKLSKLNIFDQISLFNSAKLVVGLHGAGFANVMFCKKNTKIGLLATETTIKTGIYEKYLRNKYKLLMPTRKIQINNVNKSIKYVKMGYIYLSKSAKYCGFEIVN